MGRARNGTGGISGGISGGLRRPAAACGGLRRRILASMPDSPAPTRTPHPRRLSAIPGAPAIVVLGDLVVDVVLVPERDLQRGTDVTGRVMLRQGGSAASTARWLGRLGAQSSLICAIGRDAAGRALVAVAVADGVTVHAVRVAGARTGRIGVLVEPGGERSFVTERGAALRLRPEDLRPEWIRGANALHLPAYSLLDQPLGEAGMAAARFAGAAGVPVSVDLSSAAPLLAQGRGAALSLLLNAAPDLLFATKDESRALVGPKRSDDLLELAPVVVLKRGRKGATVLALDGHRRLRFDVPATSIEAADTTGAGDAFDAGFLFGWLEARRKGASTAVALRRGAVVGNRTALRHLTSQPQELALG